MSIRALAGFLAVMITLSTTVSADPPRLDATSPVGVERGKAMSVTVHGSGLKDGPHLIAPFDFRIDALSAGGSDESTWKFNLLVDPRVSAGVYPIRVVTDSGVSNPILFAVGQVPQVAEVEPNNTVRDCAADLESRGRRR